MSIKIYVYMLKAIKRVYNIVRHKARDFSVSKKRSPRWGAISKEFLKNHPECAICGSKNKLNVHHIKPFHLYPELELDPSNFITLCMGKSECHLAFGHGDNFSCFCPNIRDYVNEYKSGEISLNDLAKIAKDQRLSN